MKRGTIKHPKTDALMYELKISRAEAVGLLSMLWDWAGEYTPDGGVGRFSNKQIASALEWDHSKCAQLVRALVKTRWLDKSDAHRLQIHDWNEHCEQWVKRRQNRINTASHRPDGGAPTENETADHVCLPSPSASPAPALAIPQPSPSRNGHAAGGLNAEVDAWLADLPPERQTRLKHAITKFNTVDIKNSNREEAFRGLLSLDDPLGFINRVIRQGNDNQLVGKRLGGYVFKAIQSEASA